MTIFLFRSALVFLAAASLLNCGVGGLRGEKSFVRVPVQTQTEMIRFNLLYGEVRNLYGVNLGSINLVSERLAGAQIGLANLSEGKTYGAQIAVYNSAEKGGFSIQLGGINRVKNGGAGIQLGGYNRGSNEGVYINGGIYNSGTNGITIGLINRENIGFNVAGFNYGAGVNVGIVNMGVGLSVGAINIGESSNFQIGILNFCSNGPFPIMIGINYCPKQETSEEKPEIKPAQTTTTR
ncbi:hypothetical protein EHQ12_04620 [Leptospira gomenensis]|uniref:PPE family protein n=1 Tax=Leptospira gomenensis TaxID=2484974 RepID=A0A5F1YGC0_9LEPT|nr:hypothetical protein EHQ17_01050 [Leptospira gomenensis]TGK42913.1 hypothetical protein EHQ12_04620 [Leptospira gomenensis]TGK60810.1 hypothetical protein EHQ13_10515 [Leptospira gomenensis]